MSICYARVQSQGLGKVAGSGLSVGWSCGVFLLWLVCYARVSASGEQNMTSG
jgi:hypothetical protein